MTDQQYKELQPLLPDQPGVYRFYGSENDVLYVGKAKSLKKRVSNYFTGTVRAHSHRTRVMVKNATRLEFTVTDSESDALLLENSLIKNYQPRYNVNLRDDKSYTYVVVKKEHFPRIFPTRKVFKDGSTYFGPYTSKARIKVILDLVKELFPLRTCKLPLKPASIEAGKFSVCLEYHIKNCMGPCIGEETEAQYDAKIDATKNILKGNFAPVRRYFEGEMQNLAENMEFEAAQQLKIKLGALEDYQSKSTVVSETVQDVDVFAVSIDDKSAYVNYVKVINGAIINTYTQELERGIIEEEFDDDGSEIDERASILSYVIPIIRERFNSVSPEVVVPIPVVLGDTVQGAAGKSVEAHVPQRGDKRKLLDMALRNTEYFRLQRKKDKINNIRKQTPAERILKTMQHDLHMDEVPMHIECFDNSNFHGSYPVSSCVVFKNARPSKKDYRHYNIKTVIGSNDFASMQEVVRRRYTRLVAEDEPLPQLVVIDGGKGQLSASYEILLELGLENKIQLIGIAKRLEEIFFPNDSVPLYINKKSESLKLIQQTRNEAHRFAITFHRDQRSRAFTQTELTSIPGVGEKTATKLLKEIGSVKKVREATLGTLQNLIGNNAGQKVFDFYQEQVVEDEEVGAVEVEPGDGDE
ncbi:MAG: excinuclease ABC subunit UvrC [Saprospiraceae bacterium]